MGILTVASSLPNDKVSATAEEALSAVAVDAWCALTHSAGIRAARDGLYGHLFRTSVEEGAALFTVIVPEFLATGLALTGSPELTDAVWKHLGLDEADPEVSRNAVQVGGYWPR
jgi:hypothetical protein